MDTLYKQQAKMLRTVLEPLYDVALGHGHALECVAGLYGLSDWNTLCARPDRPALPQQQAAQQLQVRLERYGLPVTSEDARVAAAWCLALMPQPTSLAPWPLLPRGVHATPAMLNATVLTWTRKDLNAGTSDDGNSVTVILNPAARNIAWVFQVDGQRVSSQNLSESEMAAWAAELEAVSANTSHWLEVWSERPSTAVQLCRGIDVAPEPLEPVDSRLTVTFGAAGQERLALALAYGASTMGRSYLLPAPAFTGQLAARLAGECLLLPEDPDEALAALHGAGPDDTLTMWWNPEHVEFIQAVYDLPLRLNIVMATVEQEDITQSLEWAGLRCPFIGLDAGAGAAGDEPSIIRCTYRAGYSYPRFEQLETLPTLRARRDSMHPFAQAIVAAMRQHRAQSISDLAKMLNLSVGELYAVLSAVRNNEVPRRLSEESLDKIAIACGRSTEELTHLIYSGGSNSR